LRSAQGECIQDEFRESHGRVIEYFPETVAYHQRRRLIGSGPWAAIDPSGQYTDGAQREKLNVPPMLKSKSAENSGFGFDNHQQAGPKLSGYPTSAATSTTVAQNATPGFLRSDVMAQSRLRCTRR
jgi:hypothetical protein